MVKLELTEEQARLVGRACEFFARVKMGQFEEILNNLLDIKIPGEQYQNRKESARTYLLMARSQIYPDLQGMGHSYGICRFEDADKAYDVYQVIRHAFGGPEPFSYHDLPLAVLYDDCVEEKNNVNPYQIDLEAIVSKAARHNAKVFVEVHPTGLTIKLKRGSEVRGYSPMPGEFIAGRFINQAAKMTADRIMEQLVWWLENPPEYETYMRNELERCELEVT